MFGITKSNKDFTEKSSWGKNQFNNSFPVALANYMANKDVELVYLTLDRRMRVKHGKIPTSKLYGISPSSSFLYFDFESNYDPFEQLVTSRLPRVDLVTRKIDGDRKECLMPIEIKLTTVPDNSTCEFAEEKFSAEIVVRPDTIVYLATSIAVDYKNDRRGLSEILSPVCSKVSNWTDRNEIYDTIPSFIEILDGIFRSNLDKQTPLVMQPIWKTVGKSARLSDNCLDVFVWSDYAFTRLFVDPSRSLENGNITRHARSTVWLVKMLFDFAKTGKINHRAVIDQLSFDTKNDKAFSVNGLVTYPYLSCRELVTPRIKKSEIGGIILGGGQKLLSPERRLDGVIQNTPDLFD